MSAASRKTMDECLRFSATIAPYVDGELDAGHAVDMESHMIGCAECAERVALVQATRLSLRRTAVHHAPPALCSRIRATIESEKARAVIASEPADAMGPKLIRLRYAVGLAAAAGVVFAMGMSRYMQTPREAVVGGEPRVWADTASTTVGIDGLLEELIALHARPLPPDITDPEQLQRFDPLVGVQVRRPAFAPFGANFDGARVHAVSDRGALVQLQYTVPDGKHVTVYVFNPRVVPVQAATRLKSRTVRQRSILMGRLRGYSVAAAEQSGVGYAFASDLDTDESAQMVLAALQQ
jgi:anti-sigma factor RsiW